MHFYDFVRPLRRHWLIVVASVVLVVAGTLWHTNGQVPTYQAQSRIFLTAAPPGEPLTAAQLGTYVELLRSPVVQDPIRRRLGLGQEVPVQLDATISETSSIVTVTARSSSPQGAADVANAVGPALVTLQGNFSPLLAGDGTAVQVIVVEEARPPAEPLLPDVYRNVALALLAGSALGVGLALLRHGLDPTVRDERDLAALSVRPVLARLPRLRDAAAHPVVEPRAHQTAAEEYRRLRANLQFLGGAHRSAAAARTVGDPSATLAGDLPGPRSVLVTSAAPGEGRTHVALNLAHALAETGERVLLVDADLRRPAVAQLLQLEGVHATQTRSRARRRAGQPGPEAAGLTAVLQGTATLDEATHRLPGTTLDVLPAGPVTEPGPSALLGTPVLPALFAELHQVYDRIVVDGPPLLPVVDPLLLAQLVDGTVLVVRAGTTRKADLSGALRTLATVGLDPAGFALNSAHRTRSGGRRR